MDDIVSGNSCTDHLPHPLLSDAFCSILQCGRLLQQQTADLHKNCISAEGHLGLQLKPKAEGVHILEISAAHLPILVILVAESAPCRFRPKLLERLQTF